MPRHGAQPLRVLCVVSDMLGNRAISDHLVDAIGRIDGVAATVRRIGPHDFAPYRGPRWHSVSPTLQANWLFRGRVAADLHDRFDLVVVHTWIALMALAPLVKRIPAIAAMDQVPSLMPELTVRVTPSRARRVVKRAMWHLDHLRFAPVTRHTDLFLPTTTWVRDALTHDYGVPADRCRITLGPQDLSRWKPAPRPRGERLRLLFIGNDFQRKGGALLLQAYREALTEIATLTIVSRDPLSHLEMPAGVRVVPGQDHDALVATYQSSDLFVLPTRLDMMPQVLAEALATGLPCMATDVGGVRDLVRDGDTGVLMPYTASPADWATRVRHLHEHRDELEAYGARAREFAEERLDLDAFRAMIAAEVARLLPGTLPSVSRSSSAA